VVRNLDDHIEILEKVASGIVEIGFNIAEITYSPIKGPAGNIEFLFFITKDDLSRELKTEEKQLKSEISAVVETAHNVLQ